jgi:hypothetical protein
VLGHLLGSILGLIFAIFGVFALGAYLATSRAGRLGLVAMVITVLGSALFLPLQGVSTFSAPEEGQAVLGGLEEFEELPPIFANTVFALTGLLDIVLLLAGNVLLGVAVWRSGTLPQVGGSPVGRCARADVLESRVRGDDWSREHPADGAGWGGAGSDKRDVDGLEGPAPTLGPGGRRRSPTEGAITGLPTAVPLVYGARNLSRKSRQVLADAGGEPTAHDTGAPADCEAEKP